MRSVVVCAVVCLVSCLMWSVSGSNPGLKLRLSQRGLNYAASVAVDVLSQRVLGERIPDKSGNADVNVGRVDYEIKNTRVVDFRKPSSSVVLPGGGSGLTWSLNEASISVDGDWRYSYRWGWVRVSDNGGYSASVGGVTLRLSFVMGRDSGGRPTISSTGCSSSVRDVNVRFRGGADWLYNLFTRFFESNLRSALERIICEEARKAIDVNARDELRTFDVEAEVEDVFLLDYRLMDDPVFGQGYLESLHKGRIYHQSNQAEPPFQAAPFPPSSASSSSSSADGMINIWVSDYLFNSAGHAFLTSGQPALQLTEDELPEVERGFLRTTCVGLTPCIGGLLPAVSAAHPDSTVEISAVLLTSDRPMLNTTTDRMRFQITPQLELKARKRDGTLVDLMTLRLTLAANINLTLDGTVLKGTVRNIVPTVTVVDSRVGVVNEKALAVPVRLMVNTKILSKINQHLQEGFKLPAVRHVRFINSRIILESGCLRVSSDVVYRV